MEAEGGAWPREKQPNGTNLSRLAGLTHLDSINNEKRDKLVPFLPFRASNSLHSPQRVEFRLHVLLLEALPIVVHVDQFSADVIAPLAGQKQRQGDLLLRRNPTRDPHLFRVLDLPAPRLLF